MDAVPAWMDGVAFRVAEGRANGLTDGVMRRSAFERPHHGVRRIGSSGRIDGDVLDRCADLLPALPRGVALSHATAARAWGMPLPRSLSEELHVLGADGAQVRRPGVVGWRSRESDFDVRFLHGLPLAEPAQTWAMLSTMTEERGGRLTREWLVAVADFIVSGRRTRVKRLPPLASRCELEAAVGRHGRRRGAAALSWALPRVRCPVDSPKETFLRLGLVRHRLPEPEVQPAIQTMAGPRHPDLAYLDERLLIEYLGDVHRTDPRTWRDDLTRVQLFQDAGYRVLLVGADDLTRDGLTALAARVRRALR